MLKIGTSLFDPPTRRVIGDKGETRLSPKAAGVLSALTEKPGQVWSRDALIERAWAGVIVGEEVLTHAIAELRRALGDDFRAPRHIETVHKSGYRLLADAGAPATHDESEATGPAIADLHFDVHVYADCLHAFELSNSGGRTNTLSAIALYAAAIERRPGLAAAHAGLARALAFYDTY